MRKLFHVFLSFMIIYASTTSAYANTSVGGWVLVDTIMDGAIATVNAAKTSGGIALESSAKVAASSAKVGSKLIKGGGAAALLIAVPQILGDAVDWVLDPDNNAIKYTTYPDDSIYGAWVISPNSSSQMRDSSPEALYARYLDRAGVVIPSGKSIVCTQSTLSSTASDCTVKGVVGDTVYYIPLSNVPDAVDAYLPIGDVAAQVISNAEAGHADSQSVLSAVALDSFEEGELDSSLNAAANVVGSSADADADVDSDADADADVDSDADVDATPIDYSSFLSAIKALLVGILSSIVSISDMFSEDAPADKDAEEVPIEVPEDVKDASEFDIDYISFSSQCPSLPSFSVGIGGASSDIAFDMTPLCELAIAIRPAIIAISYFIGLGVIASAIRET
jgi:hypothetical protein